MKNVRIIVNDRSYFVDEEAHSTAFFYALNDATRSGDEEKLNRTAFAFLILCLGVVEVMQIPIAELPAVTQAVFAHFSLKENLT